MYRSRVQTLSQTTTQISSNSGSSNTSVSSINTNIMFAIITGNLSSIRTLVNSSNANNIIDTKNNYTALHHAVRIRGNNEIIEYLLSCGADPTIKQNEDKDAIDLAIEANYRYIIDKVYTDTTTRLTKKITTLEEENKELQKSNEHLIKTRNEHRNRITELTTELTNEKTITKRKIEESEKKLEESERKLEESEKAFSNLLKKIRKS